MIDIIVDIMAEPQVVQDTIDEAKKRIPQVVSRLREANITGIGAVGVGSSYFAALAAQYMIEGFSGIPTIALSAMDYQDYHMSQLGTDSCLLAFSQSGETFETVKAVKAAKKKGVYTIALTNNLDSSLAQITDDLILIRAGKEEGPGTKTVLAQCIGAYCFAIGLSDTQIVTSVATDLQSAPEVVAGLLNDNTRKTLETLADDLAVDDVIYIIGCGPFWPLAQQWANVLREVAKIHCFPFEATEFRHGPLEVISKGTRLVALSSGDCRCHEQIVRACKLSIEAGATVTYIGGDERRNSQIGASQNLIFPVTNELLDAQLYLAPLQLLSYMVAKRRGHDPNQFNNIVKTWTA